MMDKKSFVEKHLDKFKAFVLESMDEGLDEGFQDHNEFLKACLETFIEIEEELMNQPQ